MMVARTVYQIHCDVSGCRFHTDTDDDRGGLLQLAWRIGWEHFDHPLMRARLWRCPACVADQKFPDGWVSDAAAR